MTPRDPLRSFSRKIPSAVEHDPAFGAMFKPGRVIPNTWGNVASGLMELNLVEPDTEAVKEFLSITTEELLDTSVTITEPHHVDRVERLLKGRWYEEYVELHQNPEAEQEFLETIEGLRESWKVEDAAKRAAELEKQADDLRRQRNMASAERHKAEPEIKEISDIEIEVDAKLELVCKDIEAYASGIPVSLAEFTAAILSLPESDGFSKAEIAGVLHDIIKERFIKWENPVAKESAGRVLAGGYELDKFIKKLKDISRSRPREYVRQKWKEVEPVFIAPEPESHFLFAGGEK